MGSYKQNDKQIIKMYYSQTSSLNFMAMVFYFEL